MISELYSMQQDRKGKKKKFRLPLGIRLQKGKFRRKNYAVVQTIKTNGAVSFRMMKIEDDTINLGDTIHDASAGHVLRYKRYPLIIVPEWNMKPISPGSTDMKIAPFSPKENFDKATEEGTLTAAEKLILTKMKAEAIKGKMQLPGKLILIILAIGAGALWLLDYLKVI